MTIDESKIPWEGITLLEKDHINVKCGCRGSIKWYHENDMKKPIYSGLNFTLRNTGQNSEGYIVCEGYHHKTGFCYARFILTMICKLFEEFTCPEYSFSKRLDL